MNKLNIFSKIYHKYFIPPEIFYIGHASLYVRPVKYLLEPCVEHGSFETKKSVQQESTNEISDQGKRFQIDRQDVGRGFRIIDNAWTNLVFLQTLSNIQKHLENNEIRNKRTHRTQIICVCVFDECLLQDSQQLYLPN